jgi:hypothetical protein
MSMLMGAIYKRFYTAVKAPFFGFFSGTDQTSQITCHGSKLLLVRLNCVSMKRQSSAAMAIFKMSVSTKRQKLL